VNQAIATRIVRDRAAGTCEGGDDCTGEEFSHRVAAGRQGLWTPSNGLRLCHMHHRWAHDHPNLAELLGWHLPTGADPLTAPVFIRSTVYLWAWVLLDDDGCLSWADTSDWPDLLAPAAALRLLPRPAQARLL
jgi:hypothetical protein